MMHARISPLGARVVTGVSWRELEVVESMGERAPETWKLGDCEVDLDTLMVRWPDRDVETLTNLEAQFLRYLASVDGRVVSHDEALQKVWGYREGVRSRAVSLLVGRLRKKIERDPKDPSYLLTAYGAGFRLALPVPEEPGEALVGRTTEVASVRSWMDGAEPVMTVVGPGGVGKSRLVRQVLDAGAVVVDLHDRRDLAGVQRAVLQALGEAAADDTDARETQIRAALRRMPGTLLVFDGAERSRDVISACLPRWMAARPGLRVVVTSRATVGIGDARRLRLGPLAPSEARSMLRSRLAAQGIDDIEAMMKSLSRLSEIRFDDSIDIFKDN